MIVLEDVDLVAMERTMPGMGNNPVLFQLLNEMDGLASDADIIFVLTTNRPELLEPALAARPGRIDQAVEIKLPDADGRRRLLELYLRGTTHEIEDLDAIAARIEGTSPAFIKELVRRAVLNATDASSATTPLIDRHLSDAVADLLEHSTPLARSILGAARDAEQSIRHP
jgi:ATP-dependent 26S proteasome regulatory subunit